MHIILAKVIGNQQVNFIVDCHILKYFIASEI